MFFNKIIILVNDCSTSQTNTFQCVLTSDGTHSFVLFLYADDLIQWTIQETSLVTLDWAVSQLSVASMLVMEIDSSAFLDLEL